MGKIRFQDIDFSKAKSMALHKACDHFETAIDLAEDGRFAQGYAHLVYCLEESAKMKICMTYEAYKDDVRCLYGMEGIPNKEHISEEAVIKVFRSHKDKQITMLTQCLFNLADSLDSEFKDKIMKSINESDPFSIKEVNELILIFKDIQTKREEAIHSNEQGEERYDFKKEFVLLFPYAESAAIARINQFTTQAFISYGETKKRVREMLDKVIKREL